MDKYVYNYAEHKTVCSNTSTDPYDNDYYVDWSLDGIIHRSVYDHSVIPVEFINKLGQKGWRLVGQVNGQWMFEKKY